MNQSSYSMNRQTAGKNKITNPPAADLRGIHKRRRDFDATGTKKSPGCTSFRRNKNPQIFSLQAGHGRPLAELGHHMWNGTGCCIICCYGSCISIQSGKHFLFTSSPGARRSTGHASLQLHLVSLHHPATLPPCHPAARPGVTRRWPRPLARTPLANVTACVISS